MKEENPSWQDVAVVLTTLLVVLMAAGCSGDEKEDVCIFSGHYEAGRLTTTPGCFPAVRTLVFSDEEDECSTNFDEYVDGIHQVGWLSCEPGDPVTDCEGFVQDGDCAFDFYMRRIGQ